MSPDAAIVFGILGIAAVLFASGRVRLDVTALLVVLALMLSGVLTPREALAGFGDPVVVLVAGLLVVGEMLSRTGVASALGSWLTRVGGTSETRMLVLMIRPGRRSTCRTRRARCPTGLVFRVEQASVGRWGPCRLGVFDHSFSSPQESIDFKQDVECLQEALVCVR